MDTYMVKVRLTPENIDDIMSAVLSSGRINRPEVEDELCCRC